MLGKPAEYISIIQRCNSDWHMRMGAEHLKPQWWHHRVMSLIPRRHPVLPIWQHCHLRHPRGVLRMLCSWYLYLIVIVQVLALTNVCCSFFFFSFVFSYSFFFSFFFLCTFTRHKKKEISEWPGKLDSHPRSTVENHTSALSASDFMIDKVTS